MDDRWGPTPRDSTRDTKVILHPIASIYEVTTGIYVTPYDDPYNDSIDVTEFVSQGTQQLFETTVTLTFNKEFFGQEQPRLHQILEIQEYQNGNWLISWVGVIDGINSLEISRGSRTLQLTARSRETQSIWKDTKRVSPLYPVMTDLMYMAHQLALTTGIREEEISFPAITMPTAHSNTQLGDITAWEGVTQILLALGLTPFIDCLGHLRGASRDLQYRGASVVLTNEQLIKVTGSGQQPGKSRIRLDWLDPVMKKAAQQGRLLHTETITMGWFLPGLTREVYFSADKSQRAMNTTMRKIQSVNSLKIGFCSEKYKQKAENKGELELDNHAFTLIIISLIGMWTAAHFIQPAAVGRGVEGGFQAAFTVLLLNIGTGVYEIWGIPYEWVHARNQTEAFNSALPVWVDDPEVIQSDFVVSEPHAETIAIRELIYKTRQTKKYQFTICDDHRLEFGDIVQFPDGTQIFVEGVQRNIMRDSEATCDVTGFLIGFVG